MARALMPLTVTRQGSQPQAVLSGWDYGTNQPIASAVATQGGSVTLHGESFAPGGVTLTLDTANGEALGTARAGPDGTFLGTFKVPFASIGKHTVVASGAGGASRATLDINVQSSVQ
jgi:hypothetical protein